MRSFVLALCLVAPATAAVKNPDTYTHLTVSDLDSLDPAWAYDTASHDVIDNVYEFLLTYKGSTIQLQPRLATRVPTLANGLISKDGLTYTFPIRKGVRFHEGQTLTPDDVKYSIERFMLFDRDGGPSALLLEPILGITSTRDAKGNLLPGLFTEAEKAVRVRGNNVVIHLKKPFAPFASILASFGAIVSKPWCVSLGEWDGTEATLAAHNNPDKRNSALHEKMNGTGPFKLERWDKQVKQVTMVRNDNYWRKPAKLKRVVIKSVEEFATRKLMLEAGDADSMVSQLGTLPQVESLQDVDVIERLHKLESAEFLAFNFAINPTGNSLVGSGKLDGNGIPPNFFTDKDVRLGIAYCIDYAGQIRDLMHGQGEPASVIIPKGLVGYWDRPPLYTLQPEKSMDHFKKAWGGQVWDKGFEFTVIAVEGQPGYLAFMNLLKKSIESINPKFKVNVRPMQWSTFLEESDHQKLPLFFVNWAADYPDAHNFVFPMLHSAGYFPSKQAYKNPKMDRLIEEAVTTLNVKKREQLYHKVQEIADADLSLLPLDDGTRYRTQRKWVKGWIFNPMWPADTPYGSDYYQLSKEDPS